MIQFLNKWITKEAFNNECQKLAHQMRATQHSYYKVDYELFMHYGKLALDLELLGKFALTGANPYLLRELHDFQQRIEYIISDAF